VVEEALTEAFTQLRQKAKVSIQAACALTGLSRATFYPRAHAVTHGPAPVRLGPARARRMPPSALGQDERRQVLAVLNRPDYADLAIPQVWARELDEGRYWCSLSTMYRIARAANQVRERRQLATHPPRVRPELVTKSPIMSGRGILRL
jgi:predicted DNA-binding transcriptional regulator AlpA